LDIKQKQNFIFSKKTLILRLQQRANAIQSMTHTPFYKLVLFWHCPRAVNRIAALPANLPSPFHPNFHLPALFGALFFNNRIFHHF
jgi:hypothetical protein